MADFRINPGLTRDRAEQLKFSVAYICDASVRYLLTPVKGAQLQYSKHSDKCDQIRVTLPMCVGGRWHCEEEEEEEDEKEEEEEGTEADRQKKMEDMNVSKI